MWDQGGQPWPQWPLSQQQWMQSFQHQQDPGQVDWAALAQAWIAQKESTGPEQPHVQPNGQDIPGLEPVRQINHGAFQGDPAFGRIWQPEWGMHGQPPPPPPPPPPDQAWIPPGSGPMDVVNPSEDSNSQDSVEFNSEARHGVYPQNSHGYGAQPDSYAMAPMAMNQFDYQHGAASSFTPTPTGFHSPYWQGPPQNRRDARPPGFRERPRSPIQLPVKQEAAAPLGECDFTQPKPVSDLRRSSGDLGVDILRSLPFTQSTEREILCSDMFRSATNPPQISGERWSSRVQLTDTDAVKRRTLPVWIREGLEKMDREKQKKLERERMEKERAEMAKDEGNQHEVDKDGDGPRVPRKSKFDSDDEGNEDNNDEAKPVIKREFSVRSPSPPAEDSEPEMTEEEKEFQLMIITKTLLTEILLEVTNEEIVHIAKDTHRKATRAPAKQLAQSSALASLTGLSGLGDYGSDESEDDDERSVRGSESSDTDEEELHHRIREKQDAFRRKERDMQQLLEKQSQEALLAREEMVKERLSREKGEHDEGQAEIPHKQEVKERQAEPMVERRRSRSEKEGSESKHSGRGKERSGRGGSHSPANGHSSSSVSTSSHSSSRSSSSSSSSSESSRSSSRSSSPKRKRRRSRSSSHKARKRSHSSHRRRSDRSEKVRDRRRSSPDRSGRHKTDRSDSRERRSHRSRSRSRDRDRGKARARESHSRSREREKEKDRDKERKRSRDYRDSSHSKHKQKASSKDRERRRDRSHSHEKDKKKKDKDKEREKDSDKKKEKPKGNEKEKEKGSSGVTEENGKSKKRRESDSFTDSQSDRHSRQESKGSKKGSAKASKKRSDSDSSRSPSPEVSKEKKSKKSKRSRSRSTEKSHKSGKKASRKHKSKSRSRSASLSRHSRR
ncbi:unnamed protein product [Pleuronectes platessa]|uniref:Arginine/serine-rich protein PNISR n=1 Tax=Pleuronectes platessa TaxID=8262 RepID=A0A9N7YFB9_PLEPL|nr:arginine/serine-rich protein PNISR isoform X1 [Pleuronectes platessa]CAB1423511.1 unnamed protein product [Pleuronectes platessa]